MSMSCMVSYTKSQRKVQEKGVKRKYLKILHLHIRTYVHHRIFIILS
uniref:Uncharacterized protein n=1 Tax=Rhizophora mucronata TaxID=61149 RepID=A0A2P2K6P4_RHIMU